MADTNGTVRELKVVETYTLLGEKRYVVEIVGTKIRINVSADSEKEALEKVSQLLSGSP